MKWTRKLWESCAEEAALCCALADELLQLVPVAKAGCCSCMLAQMRVTCVQERLRAEWHDEYVKSNPAVMAELRSAIITRGAADVREIGTLKTLLAEHATSCPVAHPTLCMNDLQRDSFELLLKQIDFDLKALDVAKAGVVLCTVLCSPGVLPLLAQAKREDFEQQSYRRKLSWEVETHTQCLEAADSFLLNFVRVQVERA